MHETMIISSLIALLRLSSGLEISSPSVARTQTPGSPWTLQIDMAPSQTEGDDASPVLFYDRHQNLHLLWGRGHGDGSEISYRADAGGTFCSPNGVLAPSEPLAIRVSAIVTKPDLTLHVIGRTSGSEVPCSTAEPCLPEPATAARGISPAWWSRRLTQRESVRTARARLTLSTARPMPTVTWTLFTMRNYILFEDTYPLMHWLNCLFMAQSAHAVIVLCARDRLRQPLFRKKSVVVAMNGDFTPFMEHPERAESRRLLGLNGHETAFLFFGQVRPYMCVPALLRAFSRVKGDNLRLLVAGSQLNEALQREVEALAGPDPRVRPKLYHIPEHDLCVLLSAADAATLPYRDILSSGVLMTALGAGLPVIDPRIGSFSEAVTPRCGIMYDLDEEELEAALDHALRSDLRAMGTAALARTREFSWVEMVRQTCAVYAYVLAHKPQKSQTTISSTPGGNAT